jgi:MoxR-like ATPase
LRELVYQAPAPASVVSYAVRLAGSSRPRDPRAGEDVQRYVQWGAGPRASQFLVLGAKAWALLNGRAAPTVNDVRTLALPVLRHRIIPNYHAIGDGVGSDRIVERLLETVAD